jgi:hypothetical protein
MVTTPWTQAAKPVPPAPDGIFPWRVTIIAPLCTPLAGPHVVVSRTNEAEGLNGKAGMVDRHSRLALSLRQGSNLRHPVYKTGALPAELQRQTRGTPRQRESNPWVPRLEGCTPLPSVWEESNLPPLGCRPSALPLSYRPFGAAVTTNRAFPAGGRTAHWMTRCRSSHPRPPDHASSPRWPGGIRTPDNLGVNQVLFR